MQKVVIKFAVLDQKSRTKALQIVSATSGKIESIAFKGEAGDTIEVIAEIDSVKLATKLRKEVGVANLEHVGPAKEEKPKEEKKAPAAADNKEDKQAPVVPIYMPPSYPIYEIRDPEPSCIIL